MDRQQEKGKAKARKRLSNDEAKREISAEIKRLKTLTELAKKYPGIAKLLEREGKKGKGQYTVRYVIEHSIR